MIQLPPNTIMHLERGVIPGFGRSSLLNGLGAIWVRFGGQAYLEDHPRVVSG